MMKGWMWAIVRGKSFRVVRKGVKDVGGRKGGWLEVRIVRRVARRRGGRVGVVNKFLGCGVWEKGFWGVWIL